MFTDAISKIDALRGQENIQPHELLDTIKDALGQCQAFLEQRGPVQIGINGSDYEGRGQGGYKLPQKSWPGAANQGDLSGYGTDYSFLPMWNPTLPTDINGFHQPRYGYPLMQARPPDNQWFLQDVFAPLMVTNQLSYWELPDAWALGIDARQGVAHNGLGGFFQGVVVFAPIDINNNPQQNNNQVAIVNHGDMVTRNIFVTNVFVGGDVDIAGNLTIEGDVIFEGDLNLTNIFGYDGAADQVLTHQNGTLTWVDVEAC